MLNAKALALGGDGVCAFVMSDVACNVSLGDQIDWKRMGGLHEWATAMPSAPNDPTRCQP